MGVIVIIHLKKMQKNTVGQLNSVFVCTLCIELMFAVNLIGLSKEW